MNKINKQYALFVGIVVLVLLLVWIFYPKKTQQQQTAQPQTSSQQTLEPAGNNPADNQTQAWVGKLETSDNASKGNYKLVTSQRTIYIKTSRDFSALVGKQVSVTYQGSWQNFVLGDITLSE